MPENGGFGGQKRTKTSILCSKTLKTGVPKAKKAQKPQFCARKDRDWHREEQPLPSCKSPRTLQKYKYLITRQLTFASVRDDLLELRPRPGDSLITYRIPAPRPRDSLITHRILAPQPGSSLLLRRYGGGVGNRCRWAERFASV